MFRVAICDDERIFREKIKEILLQYMQDNGTLFEIDTFSSGKEFVEQGIKMLTYKIVFLDINMEQLDGIMTARKIRENSREMFIVFITAFINYTIEGYKVDAVRYILKDNANMVASIYECLDTIYDKMNYEVSKIKLNFREGFKEVSMERILYIESKLHKLEFYLIEDTIKKYTLLGTLNKVETELRKDIFLRVHQSFLVNMRFILNIDRYKVVFRKEKGEIIEVNIPRARYKDVLKKFILYRGEV